MADWTHLMIHCTWTPPSFDVQREHLEKWHLEENGWSRLGYSLFIPRSGKLDILIPFDKDDVIDSWEISNGAAGWNGRTKHMCWAGGRSEGGNVHDNRTFGQHSMLEAMVNIHVMLFPQIKIIGHNQVNANKSCPSFDVPKWCREIGLKEINIDSKIYF
jgi:hypothetical protein